MSFKQRSYQKELLDEPHIPFVHIKRNMHELNTINHWLGGHRITLKGVQALLDNKTDEFPIKILEIGCGGGDNLRVIKDWAVQIKLNVQLIGVDLNPECISYAKQQSRNAGITFICSDYRDLTIEEKPHLIFSSLFCHHFTEEELIYMLQWKWEHSTLGYFINDLHRHPAAYYSIRWITYAFSKSHLVKNDAPLSVKRGFCRTDWEKIIHAASIKNYRIDWQWAFRWLVVVRK